jgi:hypothetical protein
MVDQSANEPKGYTAGNPHPGHGVDPNIMNELGHTHYPKFVDHPTDKRVDHVVTTKKSGDSETHSIETKFPVRVLVQNKKEEDELMNSAKKESEPEDRRKDKTKNW